MQNAVILINTEKGQVKAVAERLADVDGISEVYSTCGRYDLVAIAGPLILKALLNWSRSV